MKNTEHPTGPMKEFLGELLALCRKYEATIDVELEGVSCPFRVLLSEDNDGPEYAEFYVEYITPRHLQYAVAQTIRLGEESQDPTPDPVPDLQAGRP